MKWFLKSLLVVTFLVGPFGLGPAAAQGTGAQPLEEVVVTDTKIKSVDEEEGGDYDPWEPFNDKMFTFNYKLDHYVIKPVAKVYDQIILDGEKQLIKNVYQNVAMPKRFLNSLLQGKFKGAGRELARFVINSTVGGAGMTDVAKYQFGIEKSEEDTGQTFGFYGIGPGPYLVLPFLPPMTVRDGVGYLFDLAMDPINYVLPLFPSIGRKVEDVVNERALNLETYESVEEATLDLYSAVRNAYLRKREQQIKE